MTDLPTPPPATPTAPPSPTPPPDSPIPYTIRRHQPKVLPTRRSRPPRKPTRLNPALIAAICARIAAGNYLETAASAEGLSTMTVRRWIAQGYQVAHGVTPGRDHTSVSREMGEMCRLLWEQFTKAEAIAEEESLLKIRGDGHWTASAWFLERRYPARWSRPVQRVEISGDAAPTTVVLRWPDALPSPGSAARALGHGHPLGVVIEEETTDAPDSAS